MEVVLKGLHRVEHGGRPIADLRVQAAPRGDQQWEAGACFLVADANVTFFVERHGSFSLHTVMSADGIRHEHWDLALGLLLVSRRRSSPAPSSSRSRPAPRPPGWRGCCGTSRDVAARRPSRRPRYSFSDDKSPWQELYARQLSAAVHPCPPRCGRLSKAPPPGGPIPKKGVAMAAIAGCAWNSWMRRFCGLSIEDRPFGVFGGHATSGRPCGPARGAGSYHQRCCIS